MLFWKDWAMRLAQWRERSEDLSDLEFYDIMQILEL